MTLLTFITCLIYASLGPNKLESHRASQIVYFQQDTKTIKYCRGTCYAVAIFNLKRMKSGLFRLKPFAQTLFISAILIDNYKFLSRFIPLSA